MKTFLQGVKRWYLRRFRGYVGPARDVYGTPRGTGWQQYPVDCHSFMCKCGWIHPFTEADLVIREQDHQENCESQFSELPRPCSCPVTEARYVKICPQCGMGHWKQARNT